MATENQNSQGSAPQERGAKSPLDQYTRQPQQEEDKSPYFKSQAPSISLPKGGGALKGIDEKFSVNAVNGTAGLELPLPLTPGRSGFTPSLSISYSSGGGNSEFGLGWSLSLPSIQRKTDKKLPEYKDAAESDVFLLAGAEDLVPYIYAPGEQVPVVPGFTIKRYRPRTEGLFARIEHIRQNGVPGSWWRVTTRDNIVTYYGLTEEGRITDPEYDHRTFKWLPQLVTDHKGNIQRYMYVEENLDNVPRMAQENNRRRDDLPRVFTNKYLKEVLYNNNTAYYIGDADAYMPSLTATALTGMVYAFSLVLDYGEHDTQHPEYVPPANHKWPCRNDAFSDCRAGFEIRTYRKCKRALMFHRFADLNTGLPTLVHSLDLTYKHDGIAADVLVEADFITAAQQTSYLTQTITPRQYHRDAIPAITMEYEPLVWHTELKTVAAEDFRHAPQGLTGPYQWIDFEGEGISGILTEQGNGWYYKNNLGDAHFAPARSIAEKPSFQGLGNSLQWQDLEADGRRQVVVRNGNVRGFWELDDEQEWQNFKAFEENANINWNSPFTQMLDLDGDGRPDILLTEDRVWTWFHNEGKLGFGEGGSVKTFTDEEKGPVLLFRSPVQSIFLADMSGDGLTDLVRIGNGSACYWPNMGYGRFGRKVTMSYAPVFAAADQYNPIYLTLSDISGTGAADLIYIAEGKCTAWFNLSGNGFSEAHDISYLPATDPYSKIAVMDFLGNGTGCLVWSSPLPQFASAPLRYIDLMGGVKPYLLKTYHNGMGKKVDLAYKSSTQFYLEDKRNGLPWATLLPFPVHCVLEIITADIVSDTKYTQTYRYRHGYYDHEEREFRGFGYVETTDTDSATVSDNEELDQKPVLTKTWYHTGAWIREATLIDQFKKEYFPITDWDDDVAIATFPAGLNAQETREAHRALKSSPLRREVYALDGNPVPYTITASAFQVNMVQPLNDNRYASFLTYQQQSVVFNCERNANDARVLHDLTLEVDELGNTKKKAQVAYKRKQLPTSPQKVREEQSKMHISYTETECTNDTIGDNVYHLRLPYATKTYEANVITTDVTNGKLWTVDTLKSKAVAALEVDFADTPAVDQKRLLSYNRTAFMKDDASGPLPFGTIQQLAIPYENYQLAFTDKILTTNYAGKVDDSAMLTENGYVATDSYSRYWIPSGTMGYFYTAPDPEPAVSLKDSFYIPKKYIDPWGNVTRISFVANSHWLLAEKTTDAKGNVMEVSLYDWRLLQPLQVKDINSNISEILYDVLGMSVAVAIKGKDDGTEGDTLDGIDLFSTADINARAAFWDNPDAAKAILLQGATWRCVYKFDNLPGGAAAGMIARQQHVYNPVPGLTADLVVRLSYSDGLGRILMHKNECEATTESNGRSWIGSGRTIYNNKGKVVMQFEPYFSADHKCDKAEQASADGVSPKNHYDPLGRVFRVDIPDGSYTKTEWTAWQQTMWDNVDTVSVFDGIQTVESDWYKRRKPGGDLSGIPGEADAGQKALFLADTPTVTHTDTLARAFYTIQHNRYHDIDDDPVDQWIEGYTNLDILGNRLSVVDGKRILGGAPASDPLTLQYWYNMVQASGRQKSIDSGETVSFLDVAGQPVYNWDPEGRVFFMEYDELRRPLRKTASIGSDNLLLETSEYGEGQANDMLYNLRGKLFRHRDGSGLQETGAYDFKGNALHSTQQLLKDATIGDVDWSSNPLLSSLDIFTVYTIYDALNRAAIEKDPGNNMTRYAFDKTGSLKGVYLTPDGEAEQTYVQDIHYDAKGQRRAMWYGNGLKIRYTYDKNTYRVTQIYTQNLNSSSPGNNQVLQDLNYYYDPIGNITRIADLTQQTVFFNNSLIDPTQDFAYDALYRLEKVKGREQKNNAAFNTQDNTDDGNMIHSSNMPWDMGALQIYYQRYFYDKVGNITQLKHIADDGGYTRDYTYESGNNRLLHTDVASDVSPQPPSFAYAHDARGNMTEMPHLSAMNWNATNELSSVERGTTTTCYQYNSGNRMRKYVDKGSIKEERIYLGSFEIYRKFTTDPASPVVKRITVHVSDDTGRIAMLEKRTIGLASDDSDTEAELTRYIFSNHLGSTALEVDEQTRIISYEEYHPYGTTAYQASNDIIHAAAKRYRYTGKERDEESGLYYHGARYYIPWLCRWSAVDPMESDFAGRTPYCYGADNPVSYNDPDGKQENKPGDPPAPKHVIGKDGMLEYADANGNPTGNPVVFSSGEVTITAERKRSFWEKLGSFGKGLVVGLAVAVVVVAVVATGGALLAAAAPAFAASLAASSTVAAIGTGLTVAGGAATVWNTVQSLRGRDFMNNKISSMEASYNLGFGLGGLLAGPATKPINRLVSKLIPARAVTFGVDKSLQAADEASGVLQGETYLKNPTAQNADDLLKNPSGTLKTGEGSNTTLNGNYMYVVDENQNLIFGTRAKGFEPFNGKAPHPTLVGGENPRVLSAGMAEFRGGKIFKVDNLSGHFKPNAQSLKISESIFKSTFNPNNFHVDFKGFIPFKPLPNSFFYPSLLTPLLNPNNYNSQQH